MSARAHAMLPATLALLLAASLVSCGGGGGGDGNGTPAAQQPGGGGSTTPPASTGAWGSVNDGNTPQASDYTAQVLADLDVFRQAGKLVLVIDYVTTPTLVHDFYTRATAKGYVPYATVRDLNVLTVNVGHEPD